MASSDKKIAELYVQFAANTAELKRAMEEAKGEVRKWSSEMRAQTNEAKASMALLGEEIGIKLPRHLRGFVAELPGVARVMSAAFNTVAVIGLINIVGEAGRKVYEFAEKTEAAAKKNRDAWGEFGTELNETNDKLRVSNDHIADSIDKLQGKPTNGLKMALDEAAASADELGKKLDADFQKFSTLMKAQAASLYQQFFGDASTKDIEAKWKDLQERIEAANTSGTQGVREARDRGDKPGQDAAVKEMQSTLRALYDEGIKFAQEANRNASIAKQAQADHAAGKQVAPSLFSGFNSQNMDSRIAMSGGMMNVFGSEKDMMALQSQHDVLGRTKEALEESQKRASDIFGTVMAASRAAEEEGKRADEEVYQNWVKTVLDPQDKAREKQEENDKSRQLQATKDIRDQIAAQEEVIRQADRKYREVERSTGQNVALGNETNFQRYGELANAAQEQQQAKTEAYAAIANLLTDLGQHGEAAWQRAFDGMNNAAEDGQDKLTQIHVEASQKIQRAWDTALSGINEQIAALMTGGKTNWSGMFRSGASSLAKSGLKTFEDRALGHAKADGYHVHVDNLPDGVGDRVGGFSGGILSKLNGSDWASKLFGGRLFGAGGMFGGFATGGDVTTGGVYPVGELGPEEVYLPGGSHVVPNKDTGRGGAVYHIDARGTDPSLTKENFARALQATHAQAVRDASHMMADRARRRPQ